MENKQLFEKQANSYNPFFPLVRLEDIIETISDKSIQWIINNYNHLYVEYSESKAITRNKVPALLRRKGLWITYNVNDELITEYFKGDNKDVNNYVDWTHDENWERFDKLNFVDGSITYQHLSEAVKQLLGSGNTITNYPDDEDLTVKDGTLKLKDRDYDVANFSGLGHIILRKNIMVIDKKLKNVLTQDMINKKNTIYEIRYDFDLNGQEITIPEGCVLDFQGGSLSNGTINNISILNKSNNVILNDINIISPKEQLVLLKWFNYKSVAFALENASKFKHVDASGIWKLDRSVIIENDIDLFNGSFICNTGNSIYNFNIYSTNISEVKNYDKEIPNKSSEIGIGSKEQYECCLIKSNDYYYKSTIDGLIRNGKAGELMLINNISESSTTFEKSTTICSYNEEVKVQFFNPITINIRNCNFHAQPHTDKSDSMGTLISTRYAKGNISNCNFKGCSVGVFVRDSYNVKIDKCKFSDIYPWGIGFAGATCYSSVTNCMFKTHRHAWTTLGEEYVAKFNSITNNRILNCDLGITSHANAYGTFISENHVTNCTGGVGSYSPNTTITNNNIEDGIVSTNSMAGVALYEAGIINPVISNNTIRNKHNYGAGIAVIEDNFTAVCQIEPISVIINNNMITNNLDGSGITFRSKYPNGKTPIIVIKNNIISGYGYSAISAEHSYIVYIQDNIITNGTRDFTTIKVTRLEEKVRDYSKVVIKNNTLKTVGSSTKPIIDVTSFQVLYYQDNLLFDNPTSEVSFQDIVRVIGNTPQTKPLHPVIGDVYFDENRPKWFTEAGSWVDVNGDTYSKIRGNQNDRPENAPVGYLFYDYSLSKPIWKSWDDKWIDGTGTDINYKKVGAFNDKPYSPKEGFAYFCIDRQTAEGASNGIMIYHKGEDVWVDALGRVVE